MKERKYNISVRPAALDDMWFQFALRNEPYVRVSSTNRNKLSVEGHRMWFTNAISRKDRHALFIVVNTEMCPHCDKAISKDNIGYVRYERLDRKSCEVSIALYKDHQGKGHGVHALAMSMADLPWFDVEMVLANIRVGNDNSKRFFSKCGFEELGVDVNYDDVRNESLVTYRKQL